MVYFIILCNYNNTYSLNFINYLFNIKNNNRLYNLKN